MPVTNELHDMYLKNKKLFWETIDLIYPSVKEFELEYDINTKEIKIRKHEPSDK